MYDDHVYDDDNDGFQCWCGETHKLPGAAETIIAMCDTKGEEQQLTPEEHDYLHALVKNRDNHQPGEPFGCVSCGACCTGADKIEGFALPTKPDGSCINLKGRLCTIYETRPQSCYVDKFDFKKIGLQSIEEWYSVNYAACERLIRIGRIPKL